MTDHIYMRRTFFGITATILAITALMAVPLMTRPLEAKVFMEENTDRPGADYRVFELKSAAPAHCMRACEEDGKCQAWTYVKPGHGNAPAMCKLKVTVPFRAESPCCVSGVTVGTSDPVRPYR